MAGTLQALWHALCLFPSPWVKGAGESAECVMTAAWKENVCMCVFVSVHVCVHGERKKMSSHSPQLGGQDLHSL